MKVHAKKCKEKKDNESSMTLSQTSVGSPLAKSTPFPVRTLDMMGPDGDKIVTTSPQKAKKDKKSQERSQTELKPAALHFRLRRNVA